ncbi:MAG: site-2 protease family protein [Clostridia bacterium]
MKKIIVAITGPIISLILVMIFTYIEIPYITKQEAVYSNILIIIFNLLPLYPLDGGRILKGILYIQLGREKSEYLIRSVTKITIIILTIISSIAVYYFKNIAIFLVCIFLWSVILQEKNSKALDILRRK